MVLKNLYFYLTFIFPASAFLCVFDDAVKFYVRLSLPLFIADIIILQQTYRSHEFRDGTMKVQPLFLKFPFPINVFELVDGMSFS